VTGSPAAFARRTLILAPRGRDAALARDILKEAGLTSHICLDLNELLSELDRNADAAIVTEEAVRAQGIRPLVQWIAEQQPWSDFPFIILTRHGGGLERNPAAAELTSLLGNVAFLERPFHPTTLVSLVESSLRSRNRQYECRRLNEELELRVGERTRELGAANRQLLNQIEERERVESTLRQMQRLEAVGQLTSGVAHDFNNLLTVIIGNLGFLEKDVALGALNGKSAQRLSYMRIAAERGAKLTDQLLSFSRRQRLEPKMLDLNDVLAGMHQLLQSTMGGSIQIETDFSTDLWPAMVDPTQLELAVLNLAINARDAMEVGGALKVSTRNASLHASSAPEEPPPGDYVEVRVSDTGSGMSDEIRGRVFEPFFTTKEIGKGSGLGLSQVLGFAKQSNGGVRIDSSVGEGTIVSIYLPRSEQRAQREESGAHSPSSPEDHRGGDVLLVDDDSAVREVAAAMLADLGYRVHQTGSAGAALEYLNGGAPVDMVLMDFAMPGMNGAELARHVQGMRPGLPILFVTGFADRSALAGFSAAQILGKPFTFDELGKRIAAMLAQRDRETPTEFTARPAT
jgi:signal transduction histidine kinase/ActR/RegA family two-component response regulator